MDDIKQSALAPNWTPCNWPPSQVGLIQSDFPLFFSSVIEPGRFNPVRFSLFFSLAEGYAWTACMKPSRWSLWTSAKHPRTHTYSFVSEGRRQRRRYRPDLLPQEHRGYIKMLRFMIMLKLSSATISSSRNRRFLPCGKGDKSSEDGVWLPMWWVIKTLKNIFINPFAAFMRPTYVLDDVFRKMA